MSRTEDDQKYTSFAYSNGDYHPFQKVEIKKSLEPGTYKFTFDDFRNKGWFTKIDRNYDGIVDIPSIEYETLTNEMDVFLKNDTKDQFTKYDFIYKRNTLLYGPPGTGKTALVNRVAEKVVNAGGIVLFFSDLTNIKQAFDYLNDIQPDILTMVIFEEFEYLTKYWENDLLSLLDGEIQKQNVVYMATTNYIEKIPPRIYRTGRFQTKLEIGYPDANARKHFLEAKVHADDLDMFNMNAAVEGTEGFTIDEIKEVILSTCCLRYELDYTINRIRATREFVEAISPEDNKMEIPRLNIPKRSKKLKKRPSAGYNSL